MNITQTNEQQREIKAWVAFTGQTDMSFLKVLKPGFRHCFVIINDGDRWMSIDPLSNHMEVVVHNTPVDFDLPEWLTSRGNTVVKAKIDHNKVKRAPLMPFTCVEAVKRFLGIHSYTVFTPWQLYRFLKKQNAVEVSQKYFQPRLDKGFSYGQFAIAS